MPLPRTIRYSRIPRNGSRIRNTTHRALTPPPVSESRNRSPKIAISSQNQMMNRKNSSMKSRMSPLPNVVVKSMPVSFVVT